MAAPLTTISYRLQNVDFLSYIELPEDTAKTEMRPFKDSTRQQWKFVAAGNDAYYIQNVAKPDQYFQLDSPADRLDCATQNVASKWKVIFNNGSYRIFSGTSPIAQQYWIYTDGFLGRVTTNNSDHDNQKWTLLPVTPLLVDNKPLLMGYYRIRSFNGSYLLTIPFGNSVGNTNVYVKTQDADNPSQRWLVARQADGMYVIQSADKNAAYMGCGPSDPALGFAITAMAKPFAWDLNNFGPGFAWSISVPQSQLSIGFANYTPESDDDVALETSDNAPSQMWFFEKYVPLGNDTIHAEQQVAAGNYRLQSCRDDSIYMNVASTPWRISPGTATTASATFALQYNPNSPQLTLSFVPTTGAIPVADLGGYLGFASTATNWVLLSEHKNDPGFYICRPDAGHPRKVISSRVTTDINQNKVFAIDNMTPGDETQMWNLVKVA